VSKNKIHQFLSTHGPATSSEIKLNLMSSGLSDEAARKLISRKGNGIRVFTTFSLPKRESFLYLDQDFNSHQFWHKLFEAHISKRSAYGVAIGSLIDRGGSITLEYFKAASGSPKYLKKHLSHEFIISKLINAKIIESFNHFALGPSYRFTAAMHMNVDSEEVQLSKLLTEDLIIDAVSDWLKKTGLASYGALIKRSLSGPPSFGAYAWDITAPSYILPLKKFSRLKKKMEGGFVAVDVINGEISERGLRYFIKKCESLSAQNNISSFIPILIANRFSERAFRLGREKGYILTTPRILFGEEIAKAFLYLTEVLANAAAAAIKHPDKIVHVFDALKSIEGSSANIKGALFEMLAGHLLNKKLGVSIDIGECFTDKNGNKAEVDVFGVLGKHTVYAIECKARNASSLISDLDIEKWLNKKIPIIYKAIKQEPRFANSEVTFEYWTTSGFTDSALQLLNNYNSKKWSISWKSGEDIINYARDVQAKPIADVVRNHFINAPLAKALKK
jgi:hypothetical protein